MNRFCQVQQPGAADRILSMAERQSAHRIAIENIAIKRQLNQSGVGQWIAGVLAALLICAGSFLIYSDYDWAGATIITGTLVSLVLVFVKGKENQRSDLNDKK